MWSTLGEQKWVTLRERRGDGLTRALSDQEILAAVTAAAGLHFACEDLIQSAKDAGGEDTLPAHPLC